MRYMAVHGRKLSDHAAEQVVDVLLAVSVLAALDVVQALLGHAPLGRGQLEGPQEVGSLLEVGPDRVDLVDQILDAADVVLPQCLHRNPQPVTG
jgi:hypothetical protein